MQRSYKELYKDGMEHCISLAGCKVLPEVGTDRMLVPAPWPALPVEASEIPLRGSHGWLVLAEHSIVLVTEEVVPWGPVALGDGGDIELLWGDFFEGT